MAEEKTISIKERIIEISTRLSIKREGKNNFQGFEYFKPDDILREITPLLKEYSLFSKFEMTFNKEKNMYETKTIISDSRIIKIEGTDHSMLRGLEPEIYLFDIPLTQVKGAGEAQNAGATMTYAKRYSYMNIFNIADNAVDPDNSKNKPADKKGNSEKKTNLEETIAMIRDTKDIETLNKWKEKIAESKIWNDVAKRSINSNIEERLKELKTR